jgi:hypothetical protein
MTLPEIASLVAAGLLGLVVIFQLALALGAPLGEATMGGRARHDDGVLTPPYRVMALVSAAMLALAAVIVLSRAGVVDIGLSEAVVAIGAWVVVGFSLLNTATNLSGRHPLERWGLSAVTVVVAVLAGYVALSGPTG